MKRTELILFLILIVLSSCRKEFEGDAKLQSPPETFMTVDKISRSGETRYTTTIEAHWWGASETGIIKGFEVSTDNKKTWMFTKNQKGTFLLELPVGADTADIAVYVRAVDDLDQRDLTPASTLYPVRNTPPAIFIDPSYGIQKVTFPALRYYWVVSDTDGVADVQGIEVAFNDTTKLYTLPGNTTAATFAAEIKSGVVDSIFLVYQNTKTTAQTDKLTGVKYDQNNTFYVRAYDRTGSRSKWATDTVFIKKPKSDILLINDCVNLPGYHRTFYSTKLNALGSKYSNFDFIDYSWAIFPTDNFTITKNFDYFKKVIWISDNAFLTLKIAASGTTNFFNNDGKMLMVIDFGGSYFYNESQVGFTPISGFVDAPNNGQFRMDVGDNMIPTQSGWPTLSATSFVMSTVLRPFSLQNNSGTYSFDSLYKGNLYIPSNPPPNAWTGNSLMIAKRKVVSTGTTNLVFSSIPLDLLQGNSNIDTVFKKIIIDELKF